MSVGGSPRATGGQPAPSPTTPRQRPTPPRRARPPPTTDVRDPLPKKHTPESRTTATVGTDHRGWCNLGRSVERSVASPGPASGGDDSTTGVEAVAAADPWGAEPRAAGRWLGSGPDRSQSAGR